MGEKRLKLVEIPKKIIAWISFKIYKEMRSKLLVAVFAPFCWLGVFLYLIIWHRFLDNNISFKFISHIFHFSF